MNTHLISKPTSQTEQTAEGNPCCEHCGRPLNSSKPSVREIVINSASALLLLAILVPLGWQINKAVERPSLIALSGIELIVPYRKNSRLRRYKDGRKLRRYKRRWIIERTHAWLGQFRRLLVRH
jgi:hypothetical protein